MRKRNNKSAEDYSIKSAQKFVRDFARQNQWQDFPNIDKFDHLHEELLEMSQYLRYKSKKECAVFVSENKEIFVDGMGDLFFGACRLANQLGVDLDDSFNLVTRRILKKYKDKKGKEINIVKKKQ